MALSKLVFIIIVTVFSVFQDGLICMPRVVIFINYTDLKLSFIECVRNFSKSYSEIPKIIDDCLERK